MGCLFELRMMHPWALQPPAVIKTGSCRQASKLPSGHPTDLPRLCILILLKLQGFIPAKWSKTDKNMILFAAILCEGRGEVEVVTEMKAALDPKGKYSICGWGEEIRAMGVLMEFPTMSMARWQIFLCKAKYYQAQYLQQLASSNVSLDCICITTAFKGRYPESLLS